MTHNDIVFSVCVCFFFSKKITSRVDWRAFEGTQKIQYNPSTMMNYYDMNLTKGNEKKFKKI
jgi:hypothetical protein